MPGLYGNTMNENVIQGDQVAQQQLGRQPFALMQQPLQQIAMNGMPGQDFASLLNMRPPGIQYQSPVTPMQPNPPVVT